MELDFSAWPSRTTMFNLAWSFIKKCKFCNLFRAGGRPSPRLASKQLFIILNQLCFWKCASAACSNVATGLEDCVCRTRLGPPRVGQQLESQMQLLEDKWKSNPCSSSEFEISVSYSFWCLCLYGEQMYRARRHATTRERTYANLQVHVHHQAQS